MLVFSFTLDYEIFGNGAGDLETLVYKPTEKLRTIFNAYSYPFVVFVECAELQRISYAKTDQAIARVEKQINALYDEGHEIALHIHSHWFRAQYEKGHWVLEYSDYNLCKLDRDTIDSYVKASIHYLQKVVGKSEFTPTSFRAGNWLFQPSGQLAEVLSNCGISVDSSVFKGGRLHIYGLNYKRSLKNGYWWKFHSDINQADESGCLLEVPIFTKMVPTWEMFTKHRVAAQRQYIKNKKKKSEFLYTLLDMARITYPQKFDFAKMTFEQMRKMYEYACKLDLESPETLKPIVLIGHSKDLVSFEEIDRFLSFLAEENTVVKNLKDIKPMCIK